MTDEVRVPVVADTAPFEAALKNLTALSEDFGRQLTGALKSAVVSGKSLEDVLRRIALNLAGLALEQGLKPLQGLLGAAFGGLAGSIGGVLPFARGGVVPFAEGGVVSAPTYFPAGRNIGLMGEAGAEAILPLQRAPDGRLGVAASSGRAAPTIVFNVTTPDASSFRKSEAQITGMLTRAVSRGARGL
ncbi:phage tail tape measure protein [Chelativorans intermedius]|uniref:Phage tail tape measure protein n=1 Tax=Chelativorans intermedius TaxID=515947 RepID=A0ABV6DC16_9HYPH|nr:phage tail tape measure protein [Chelativorans intermedius]MCT8999648.1 phage tail tape measure protein [Chelativorans intermedius]